MKSIVLHREAKRDKKQRQRQDKGVVVHDDDDGDDDLDEDDDDASLSDEDICVEDDKNDSSGQASLLGSSIDTYIRHRAVHIFLCYSIHIFMV